MGYIKKETVETVLETSNMVEVIKEFVDLKKSGSQYKGLSPFNKEKTGSFMVSPAKGIWKDFSSGKGGNNAVNFLMEKEGFTFVEAIEWLAKKYSIEIEYDNSETTKRYHEKEQRREELRLLLEWVILKYEEEFSKLPETHPAKIEIYQKRKYSREIVDLYRIGYSPGKRFIYDLCVQAGRKNDAIELGLINENNDIWYDRIIYPLIDSKGSTVRPVGLAGRRLIENDKYPKWLNSKDSDLYRKDFFWYGLDKARTEIVKRGEVWIVEGYNDVIAWQTNGILNTVAACGTAISSKQIHLLKRLCDRVIFCFDPDQPGKDAMLKYIPEFMSQGFRVQSVTLDPELDPDDYIRHKLETTGESDVSGLGTNSDYRDDGFKFLMQETFRDKDDIEKAREINSLATTVAKIADGPTRVIMAKWLSKESGVPLAEIKELLKEKNKKKKDIPSPEQDDFYILPPSVEEQLDKIRPEIEKYQMFMANDQIWVQTKKDGPPYSFKSVSNFSIRIITHMHDENFPMKLIRMKNIHGIERIFDMKSADMNSPMSFENAITAQGNFRWKGNRNDHELLKTYLFDKMGTGKRIDILGWQPEEFWVWNNKIVDPTGEQFILDENGVFERRGISYYMPSANSIYRSNLYKYESQKKLVSIDASVPLEKYLSLVTKVHRNHGMTGILFSLASIFQDIVVAEVNSFPMLFLYGPTSSGKDQLANICQSFFGLPQTAINLEGAVSTIKAQVREFAQFSNAISHLSEYNTGNSQLDGVLKGLWDRVGYKRGTLDSKVSTDSIPILSSVIMTGNFAPEQDALIGRLIWEFMDKTEFSQEETVVYHELNDITKKGISSYTDDLLLKRSLVKENFKNYYRKFKSALSMERPKTNSRMLTNLSVLGAFYDIFRDEILFPFSRLELLDHFKFTIDKQMSKLDNASITNKWWNCFLDSLRGNVADKIILGRDFKIEGDRIYFNFTNCFNKISRKWNSLYKKDFPPATSVMQEALKKDSSWIDTIGATRMSPGRNAINTSAYILDISKIPNGKEIRSEVDYDEGGSFPYSDSAHKESHSTSSIGEKVNKKIQRDLPF